MRKMDQGLFTLCATEQAATAAGNCLIRYALNV
jgi:hypothetical protein